MWKMFRFGLVMIIIVGWVFSGWPQIWNFPPEVKNAAAVVGEVYIARAADTNLVTNIDGTEQTLTYDTEVKTSNNIVRQSGNQAFRIQNSGRYLIITSTSFNYIDIANNNKITIFRSEFSTTHVIQLLSYYLERKFAPSATLHGSMVDVYGIGVLITGRSGIGKSEIALDLVERGHRLVADDVIHISRQAEGVIIATGSEVLQHHMEIRGIGIIDIRSIFGIRGIRYQKRIEVEVHLEDWQEGHEYERTGMEEKTNQHLNVDISLINLPIFPGKNVTVIIEVIALNQLLKLYGFHTAKEFNERLIRRIQTSSEEKEYLFSDLE